VCVCVCIHLVDPSFQPSLTLLTQPSFRVQEHDKQERHNAANARAHAALEKELLEEQKKLAEEVCIMSIF